jgi:hypothetical protein
MTTPQDIKPVFPRWLPDAACWNETNHAAAPHAILNRESIAWRGRQPRHFLRKRRL